MANSDDVIDQAIEDTLDELELRDLDSESDLADDTSPADGGVDDQITIERKRDKSGKFAEGKARTKQAASKSEDEEQILEQESNVEQVGTEEGEQQVQSQPLTDLPRFWPAELKSMAAKAPKELVAKLAQYEAQREQWAHRVSNEAQKGKQYESRIEQIFTPERKSKLLAARVKDPLDAVEYALGWNDLYQSNPRQYLREMAAQNGFSADDIFGDGTEESATYQTDPRVEALEQRLAEYEEKFQGIEQAHTSRQDEELFGVIEQFKNGTDKRGQVRRQFTEAFHPQIYQAFQQIQAQDSTRVQIYGGRPMTTQQALEQAYDLFQDHMAKQGLIATQTNQSNGKPRSPEQLRQQAKRARNAASSVTGAPGSGSGRPGNKQSSGNWDEHLTSTVDDVLNELGM